MSIGALRQKLAGYLSPEMLAAIDDAYLYSKNAHSGQTRDSGKPYIGHPLAVADILADWRFDAPSIIAALLHDVVEDTAITLRQIKDKFGGDIANLVDGLSKIERLQGLDRDDRDAENFRKLLLAAAADWRVLFVKLADRLHNMRTLSALSDPARRRIIARQTLDIYAPIAARLGARRVQDELQNLAFRHWHPHRFRVLTKALNKSNANARNVIAAMEESLRAGMDASGVSYRLEKRQKNLFSIHQKMERERLSFAKVEDIIGARLIVGARRDCYVALGVIHELFFPLIDRFKDFIAIPKSNGYQSLHTRVMGKGGVRLDAQIRTAAMHEVAENGLAAHWRYKEGGGGLSETQAEALRRLSSLVRLHAENAAPAEFMEHVKVDLFPAEMHVLTPKGKVVSLPRGATALDMAYAVHTEVGDHAERAIINGHSLPLSMRLNNGDQVEIVANPNVAPLPHWLRYANTARARSRIRRVLQETAQTEYVAIGKSMLAAALRKLDELARLDGIGEADWRAFLGGNNMKSREDLYRAIVLGEFLPDIAARALLRRRSPRRAGGGLSPVPIAGAGRSAIHLSPCCHPLPFEPLVGLLRKERGLIVHSGECPVVRDANRRSEKWTETQWSEDAGKRLHHAACQLECSNRPGLVTAVTATISNRDINIVSFYFDGGALERDSLTFEMILEVPTLATLNDILRELRRLPEVLRAERRFSAAAAGSARG